MKVICFALTGGLAGLAAPPSGASRQALDADIPVVLANVAGSGYEKFGVGFVGQDFIPAGDVCGREIAKYAQQRSGRKDGIIIAGNFSPGNSALEQRVEGIRRGVEAANQANGTSYTVEVLVTSSDESKSVAAIDARYTRDRDRIAGWAMSGFDHQFVAAWATSKNLVGKFGVGGFDLIAPVLDGIKDKSIDFSIGQNPWAQGWVAASLVAMQINPGFPGGNFDTGAEIVDASNIDQVSKRESAFA